MATWDFAQSLAGAGDKLVTLKAGSGGWAKGDPLTADGSGGFVRPTATTAKPKYVAAEAVTSGNSGCAIPALPTNVFRVASEGTVVVGAQYGLTATTLTINGTDVTSKGVEIIGFDETTTTIAYVVSRGWLA
jgi:hypothetical protein